MNILKFDNFYGSQINENNHIDKKLTNRLMQYALTYAIMTQELGTGDIFEDRIIIGADVEDQDFIVKSKNGKEYQVNDILVHLKFDAPSDVEVGIVLDEDDDDNEYSDLGIIPLEDIVNLNELIDFVESIATYGK